MDGFQWIATDLASVCALPSVSGVSVTLRDLEMAPLWPYLLSLQDWTWMGSSSVHTDVLLRVTVMSWAV